MAQANNYDASISEAKLVIIMTHYSDVIMSALASQITIVSMFAAPFIQAHIKKTSKLRITGLCAGEPTGGRWTPHIRASNAGNASIW